MPVTASEPVRAARPRTAARDSGSRRRASARHPRSISISTAAISSSASVFGLKPPDSTSIDDGQEAAEAPRHDAHRARARRGSASMPHRRRWSVIVQAPGDLLAGAQRHQLIARRRDSAAGTVHVSVHSVIVLRVARQAVEIRRRTPTRSLRGGRARRRLERFRVQLDGGVRGEDAGAAAGMSPSCAARAARCRCRGRSARSPLVAASSSAGDRARASAPAGSSCAGGCRP